MPRLVIRTPTGRKKSASDEWLGSARTEEEFDVDLEPDPLFDMPSAAAVRNHETSPVEDSADVSKLMAMMQQQQDLINSLQGQVDANTTGRLHQTPQGTLAHIPYQVRFSCESCVKTIT